MVTSFPVLTLLKNEAMDCIEQPEKILQILNQDLNEMNPSHVSKLFTGINFVFVIIFEQ